MSQHGHCRLECSRVLSDTSGLLGRGGRSGHPLDPSYWWARSHAISDSLRVVDTFWLSPSLRNEFGSDFTSPLFVDNDHFTHFNSTPLFNGVGLVFDSLHSSITKKCCLRIRHRYVMRYFLPLFRVQMGPVALWEMQIPVCEFTQGSGSSARCWW